MAKYLLRRLMQTIIVLLIVSVAAFLLTSLMPGDPVIAYYGSNDITPEAYDRIFLELNLDKPIWTRFGIWFWNALHMDFGNSYVYKTPVWGVILQRLPVTLYLAFISLIISVPLGVLFGVLTAVKRGTFVDTLLTLLANILACLPRFLVGVLLLYWLCIKNGLLPSYGFDWSWNVGLHQHIRYMIIPISCLALSGIAGFTRQTRSSVLEVIRQDYVRTARAKGLREQIVISKHVLRNSLLPIITILGTRFAQMIGGAVFVENVFTIPGMGTMIMTCINSQDIPMIQALVLITALICCIVNILTDLLYVIVDPRIGLVNAGN